MSRMTALPQPTTKVSEPSPAPPSRVEQIIALLRQHEAEITRPERGSLTVDFAGGKVGLELKVKLASTS